MSKIIKSKFKICNMHCTSCAMNIDFNLEDLEGVVYAKTSYAKCECEVAYDDEKLSEDNIISTIKEAGYVAQFITKT